MNPRQPTGEQSRVDLAERLLDLADTYDADNTLLREAASALRTSTEGGARVYADDLWRCPVHGLIQPKVIEPEWPAEPRERKGPEDYGPDDKLCPVPGYDETPCEESLTPAAASEGGEAPVEAARVSERLALVEGIIERRRDHIDLSGVSDAAAGQLLYVGEADGLRSALPTGC